MESSPAHLLFPSSATSPPSIDLLTNELRIQRELNYSLMHQVETERFRAQHIEETLVAFITKWPDYATKYTQGIISPIGFGPGKNSTPGIEVVARKSYAGFQAVPSDLKRYPAHIRQQKIDRYKAKLKRRREKHSVVRKYIGRSALAKSKPRMNGKFVKTTEAIST